MPDRSGSGERAMIRRPASPPRRGWPGSRDCRHATAPPASPRGSAGAADRGPASSGLQRGCAGPFPSARGGPRSAWRQRRRSLARWMAGPPSGQGWRDPGRKARARTPGQSRPRSHRCRPGGGCPRSLSGVPRGFPPEPGTRCRDESPRSRRNQEGPGRPPGETWSRGGP